MEVQVRFCRNRSGVASTTEKEDPAGPQMSKGRLERCPQIARREHIRYGIEEDNRVKRFT